jgi:DNA ligase 1
MTTLYKTNKNGSIQQWSIEVSGPTFTCIYGQVGGKLQSQQTICKSVNIGKSNETTPEQQAQLEADALVAKKIKSGYSYDKSAPVTVQLPMKVKAYQDQLHNVKFPCFSACKLDGVNAIYRRENGKLTIYSRGGEVYPPIPHLEPLVHKAMDLLHSNELNGELYIHGEHLQDIQSAVKKPNQLSAKLSFCIFDIADSTDKFYERAMLMHKHNQFDTTQLSTVSVVYNVTCQSTADIEQHYVEATEFGYEGTVIKNYNGLYQHNVRSSDQFKYKKAQSAEFLIVSYELDKNGLPVFILESAGGEFKAKPIGTKEYWSQQIPTAYIGQYATVEYETFSKSGIPLKPIFISTRKLDASGTPLE